MRGIKELIIAQSAGIKMLCQIIKEQEHYSMNIFHVEDISVGERVVVKHRFSNLGVVHILNRNDNVYFSETIGDLTSRFHHAVPT
jgi:hypothetical protein